jgi:hypothetical protein
LKKIIIIAPHFPPINAPDMQRIRMSLPYYKEYGWDAEVVYVEPKYVEGYHDSLLIETVPDYIKRHTVKALPAWLTRKFGLGSLSIRSLIFYFFKVNTLLKKNKFDLVFFSTTMFHLGVLGIYWKWRFNVPFVIDLQDPWRNDYYLDKPKSERPPKFWISYFLLKWTEQLAIPKCSGLISVSNGYIAEIKKRYPSTVNMQMAFIPFGTSIIDFELVKKKHVAPFEFNESTNKTNIVYIGAVTSGFIPVIRAFFKSLINNNFNFENHHFYFLGTSYSLLESSCVVFDLAKSLGISDSVTEHPRRIPYFQALATLQSADILFVPGSLDVDYNASKIYNLIVSGTPIYGIFNNNSEVKRIVEKTKSGIVIGFDGIADLEESLNNHVLDIVELKNSSRKLILPDEILANFKTKQQCDYFNLCI